MKLFSELTQAELLKLTSEQIDDLAKLELLKEGERLPYDEPQIPRFETFVPQAEAYVFDVGDYYFTNEEDAQEAKRALGKGVALDYEYNPGRGPNIKTIPSGGFLQSASVEVKNVPVFSKATAKRIISTLKDEEALKKPWSEWRAVMDKYQEARSRVLEAIELAYTADRVAKERDAYMQECLRLSGNDEGIAQRFFEKRYPPGPSLGIDEPQEAKPALGSESEGEF